MVCGDVVAIGWGVTMLRAEAVIKLPVFRPPSDEVLIESNFGRPSDADITTEACPPGMWRSEPLLSPLPFNFLASPAFFIHRGIVFEKLYYLPEWEKEKVHSSQSFVQNLETKRLATQEKLDKLVSAYIDGDIPNENYLTKKEELLRKKVSLAGQKEDFGRMGKN